MYKEVPLMVKKTIKDMPVREINGVKYRCINDLLYYSTSYKKIDISEAGKTKKSTKAYEKQLIKRDGTLKKKIKQATKKGEDLKEVVYDMIWSGYTPKQVAMLLNADEWQVKDMYHKAKNAPDRKGVSKIPIRLDKEDTRTIITHRLNGYRPKKIAELMNREPVSVRHRVITIDRYIESYEEFLKLSHEDKDAAIELYKMWGTGGSVLRGEVRKEIGRDIDIKGAISYMIATDKIEDIERGYIYDEVYELYKQGKTYREIGETYGRDTMWAHRWVNRVEDERKHKNGK